MEEGGEGWALVVVVVGEQMDGGGEEGGRAEVDVEDMVGLVVCTSSQGFN